MHSSVPFIPPIHDFISDLKNSKRNKFCSLKQNLKTRHKNSGGDVWRELQDGKTKCMMNSIKKKVVQAGENETDEKVEVWLAAVGQKFSGLTDEEKNRTLDYLIGNSGARQLYHLSEKLNCLLKRDFLKHLPIEMSFYLLKFLDPESLLACCQVSHKWNKVVNSCVDCWKRACDIIGVKQCRDMTSARDVKELFLAVYARQESLKQGTALEAEFLQGHTDRVMAVYYKDGLLATGSDDRTVRLWDCATCKCIKIFRTHTVADVKFDSKQVITASFDNTAACWDMATGERVRHYRGHIGAVFTVDYDEDVDVLVTGGVDYTIKIWLFSEALLLHSLNTYNAGWITRVVLHRPEPTSKNFAVVCIDYSYIYVWNMDGQQKAKDFRGWPAAHSCFVPSLLKEGNNLYCCVSDMQRSMYSIQKNQLGGAAGSELIPLNYPGAGIQAMFGVGQRFSMFLSDTPVDGYMLDIIQGSSKKFTSIELPDCRPTRRGSTFTLGERGWLDGFDGSNDAGVFFAASLRDHSIYLLKWNPKVLRKRNISSKIDVPLSTPHSREDNTKDYENGDAIHLPQPQSSNQPDCSYGYETQSNNNQQGRKFSQNMSDPEQRSVVVSPKHKARFPESTTSRSCRSTLSSNDVSNPAGLVQQQGNETDI